MSDEREYIPEPGTPFWVKNPAFTGNKFRVNVAYPVKLLRGKFGYGPAKKGAIMDVERSVTGQLRLKDEITIFHSDPIEGVDFELI